MNIWQKQANEDDLYHYHPELCQKRPDRLPDSAFKKVLTVLHQPEINPRPSGCKKLKGQNAWSVSAWIIYRRIFNILDKCGQTGRVSIDILKSSVL